MRKPSATDFVVQVEGLGAFTFAKRTLGDELRIQAEHSRIIDGNEAPTNWLYNLAVWMSALRVLMVAAPLNWKLEELDPLDPETFDQISRVYVGLREKEESFRRKPGEAGQGAGSGNCEDDRLLVPAEVQSPAE